jgi:uncharacterized integral membrane protein
MLKNKIEKKQIVSFDNENVIEVHQNPNKKYQLIFGIVSGILLLLLIITAVQNKLRNSS